MRPGYLLIFIVLFSIFAVSNVFPSESSTTITNSTNSMASNKVFTSSIDISNNNNLDSFIKSNGFSGTGSPNSPYIIDNLQFNVQYTTPTGFNQTNSPLFTLTNTNRYLIIKNCTFDEGTHSMGLVYFQNVSNVQILQNTFNSNYNLNGLVIIGSINILVKDNTIINNFWGILEENNAINSENSTLQGHIEICNNFFENNDYGIYSLNQNYISINNNYFKNNSKAGIDIDQSNNVTISNINHNIFDNNANGIIFYLYALGFTYIYLNDFYNQKSYGIIFNGNYNGSIYSNNFIYNASDLIPYSVCSFQSESGISLDNATTGNYFADFQGSTTITNYGAGFTFTLYQLDTHPLKQPVAFNITVNGKLYVQPSPNNQTSLLNNFLFQSVILVMMLVIAGVTFTYYKRKKGNLKTRKQTNGLTLKQKMICPNCGFKQAVDSEFCSNCGQKIH